MIGPTPQDPAQSNLASADLALQGPPMQSPVGLDEQFQAMNGVERSWMMPRLPDQVKLDLLANPGIPDAGSMKQFLWGLHDDVNQASTPQMGHLGVAPAGADAALTSPSLPSVQGAVAPTATATSQLPGPNLFLPADDVNSQLRRVWNGIAGLPADRQQNVNAVENLKVRGIESGLLPANTPIDSRWDPQMNTVRAELMKADFQSRILGSRPGAVRTKNLMDLVTEWTSPSGLISAAVTAGFLPDIESAKKNFQSFADTRNPFDLLKGVADIALPIVNDALLFTGVSEVVAFARGVSLAREGLAGAGLASRLAETGSVLGRGLVAGEDAARLGRFSFGAVNAVDVSSEVARFKRAGLVASRLQKSSVAGVNAAGDVMAQWRNFGTVQVAKKAVQQGMKLGIAAQLESHIDPGIGGWNPLGGGSQEQRKNQLQYRVNTNPYTVALTAALELPFAPPTIFREGAIVTPVKSAANFLRESITKVPDDARLTSVYFDTIAANLAVRDEATHASFLRTAKEQGPQQAVVDFLGGGDKERAGKVLTFMSTTAAVNFAAETKAVEMGIDRFQDPLKFQEAYHLFRNKLINQLRPIETFAVDDTEAALNYARQRSRYDFGDFTDAVGDNSTTTLKGNRKAVFKSIAGNLLNPETAPAAHAAALEEIAHHNDVVRQQTLHDLFAQPGIEDRFVTHLTDAWDRVKPDQWDVFEGAQRRLEELYALDGLKVINPRSDQGWNWVPSSLADSVTGTQFTSEVLAGAKSKGILDSFGGTIDPLKKAFTAAREDTITRQQAAMIHGYLSNLLAHRAALREAQDTFGDTMWSTLGSKLAGADLNGMADDVLKSTVAELNAGTTGISTPAARGYARALRFVAESGGDPASALQHVEDQINAINRASFWDQANIGLGAKTVEEKVKGLAAQSRFLASEVDVPPEIGRYLSERGYKAVVGTDFLFPPDLAGMSGPFAEVTNAHVRRLQLGTFFAPHNMEQINGLRDRKLASELSTVLADGGLTRGAAEFGPESGEVKSVISMLDDEMKRMKETALVADEDSMREGFLTRAFTRARNSYVPFSKYDMNPTRVQELFEPIYGADKAAEIVGALKKSQHLGWEYQGLQAIETYLKSNSWARNALQTFGKTETAEGLGQWNGFRRAGVGVLSGAAALSAGANPATAAAVGVATAATGGNTVAQRAGAAGIAGAAAFATGQGPEGALGAAASAGLSPSSTRNLFNPRYAAGLTAARIGGGVALAQGQDPLSSSLVGLGTGLATASGLKQGARAGLSLWDNQGWSEYSKIADTLGRLRDRLRFSLNPFFDLQRYTEAMTLNATASAKLPDGMHLPLNPSLGGVKAGPFSWGGIPKEEQQQWLGRFRAATSKWFDADAVESTQNYFLERGILGFSPTRWMAGSFKQLVDQGMAEREAAQFVRNLYTYGTQGRSGLEQTANFVFFPFSFQKKYYGQLAKFMSQDIGRTVIVHDALKAYDILNERYDLSKKLEDHLPILGQLTKINAMAYGMNLGELGGINRPYIEAAMNSPLSQGIDPMLNLFLPQAWHIEPGTDSKNLEKLAKRMIPAVRDVNALLQDVAEQGHVAFSPSHQATAADVRDGYQEWGDFKSKVTEFATARGIKFDTMMRDPQYAPIKEYVQAKRSELDGKYPAWAEARAKSTTKSIERQQELADISVNPQTPAEEALAQFATTVANVENLLQQNYGVSMRSQPDAVPAEMFRALRQEALGYAKQGPGFESLYARYFQSLLGPITSENI